MLALVDTIERAFLVWLKLDTLALILEPMTQLLSLKPPASGRYSNP